MRPAGVAETVQVDRRLARADRHAGRRRQLQAARRSRRWRRHGRSRASRSSRPRVRRRITPERRRPSRHQRRVRVRQRVHGQRRRRQRQPVRDAAESLHRGRDRGDAGPDLGHLRRIRPVHRRRDQRDHQERRQHVLRQRPDQLPEPVLDDRDAVRGLRGHEHRRLHGADGAPRRALENLRRHVRRPDRAGPAVVLHVRPLRVGRTARRR